jgi:hypothetical protein
MNSDCRRITLVLRNQASTPRNWNARQVAPSRLIFVNSLRVLTAALEGATRDLQHDVERIVLDRTASALQYLELLANLPAGFNGDVLLVRPDGGAFLNSLGRGGDRVMYNLDRANLHFYFETHHLVIEDVVAAA